MNLLPRQLTLRHAASSGHRRCGSASHAYAARRRITKQRPVVSLCIRLLSFFLLLLVPY